MKKVVAILLVSILFVQCKKSEESVKQEIKESKVVQEKQHLVGGWQAIAVNDKIKALAAYVVAQKEISSPVSGIESAKEQIVSGKNYGFELTLENNEKWEVVVYENLQKEKEITKFNLLSN